MTIEERFDVASYSDYQRFDRVENKRSQRPDLHAFLLLDELCPNPGQKIVTATVHDEMWLDISKGVVEALTDEQILELVRCGIHLNQEGYPAMFI